MDITQERAEFLAKARDAAFLDGVFHVAYYNRHVKPLMDPNEIKAEEVFEDVDATAYGDALQRAEKLLNDSTIVGMAFFKYPDVPPYDEALETMKKENPGFSETCYSLAVGRSIQSMR